MRCSLAEQRKLTREVELLKKALPDAAQKLSDKTKQRVDNEARNGHKNRRP